MAAINSDIQDISLADKGLGSIEWALNEMHVMQNLMERFSRERPLEGIGMSGCLYIATELVNLVRFFVSGGANLSLCQQPTHYSGRCSSSLGGPLPDAYLCH